jgi:hypothetical protein
MNINGRFQVNSSGRLYAKTSGGGEFSMGRYTNHPYVSGLNVGSFGIAMHGHEIGECGAIQIAGESVGPSTTFYLAAKSGISSYSYHTMRFKYGILVAYENH